jgi:Na+-driven multidrug efflux pump
MGNKIIIDPSEDRLTISKKVSKLALPIIFSNLLYTVESGVSILLVSGISPPRWREWDTLPACSGSYTP